MLLSPSEELTKKEGARKQHGVCFVSRRDDCGGGQEKKRRDEEVGFPDEGMMGKKGLGKEEECG